jgi:hypothetical protein
VNVPAALVLSAVREPPLQRAGRPRQNARPVGARVARVAVDDETWEAFKELCGPTPASIRLGQLVTAEVQRARRPASETDALAAVEAIRARLVELETLARGKSKQ